MDAKEIKVTASAKILGILNQMITGKEKALLWQNDHSHLERKPVTGNLVKFSSDKSKLYVTPAPSEKFSFDENELVYFLNSHKTILYKSKIYSNSPYKLILETPSSIMIRDSRKDKRQNLIHKNVNISFHYGHKTGNRLEKFPFISKVLDFSYGGLSFKSNLASIKQFQNGDKITLKLNNKSEDIMEATVCYVTRSMNSETNQSYFRVGVAFC